MATDFRRKSLFNRRVLSFGPSPSRRLAASIAGALALIGLSMGASALAADYTVTSLEWAPYTGERLAAKGAASTVVVQAFAAAGNTAEVRFFPWSRATSLVKADHRYTAYFPEYYSAANAVDFLYSDPIGVSPLVFVEHKSMPLKWQTYDDLKDQRIGVVRNYVNTEELDARIAAGTLAADEAPDDTLNILKLAAGRVDLVVIDANVFNYLALNTASVRAVAAQLQIKGKVLEDRKLYVCFKKSNQGAEALEAFNRGLKRIDANTIMKAAMN